MANIYIPIDQNGTKTLLTAGKFCDRNIDISVSIHDHYDEGYVNGMKDQYNAFWDAYQQNGERTYYRHGFCGSGWNANTFKPMYAIKISGNGEYAFACFDYQAADRDNLVDLSTLNPNIDWSKVTDFTRTFYCANFANVGLVDVTSSTKSLSYTFASGGSKGFITKITLKVNESTTYANTFNNQTYLTDLIFTEDSVIGNSGIDLSDSTLLSKASVQSILNALSDDVSGKSIVFSKAMKTRLIESGEWDAEDENGTSLNSLCTYKQGKGWDIGFA